MARARSKEVLLYWACTQGATCPLLPCSSGPEAKVREWPVTSDGRSHLLMWDRSGPDSETYAGHFSPANLDPSAIVEISTPKDPRIKSRIFQRRTGEGGENLRPLAIIALLLTAADTYAAWCVCMATKNGTFRFCMPDEWPVCYSKK